MGAINTETTDCVFDPQHLLQHVFNVVRREPVNFRPGST